MKKNKKKSKQKPKRPTIAAINVLVDGLVERVARLEREAAKVRLSAKLDEVEVVTLRYLIAGIRGARDAQR